MLRSMTGFGRSTSRDTSWSQTWEIKSVNSKQMNIKWRIPSFLAGQQADWERMIREYANRGWVEVNLNVQPQNPDELGLFFNVPLAKAMLKQVQSIALEQGDSFEPDYNRLLNIPSLWQDAVTEPDEHLIQLLSSGLENALKDWTISRVREGEALQKDLLTRIATIKNTLAEVSELAPRAKENKFQVVTTRVREILETYDVELNQDRMLQEIALLADKLDISEELTRLSSHFTQIEEILSSGGETGRRLDFLFQEAFREINTCGNKAQDSRISRMVVDMKVEMEKCREQVQNLE